MAAKYFYRQGFLLLLFNFISTAALEKRFSDFKRCADEECSMLLCRGKAVEDFSGPDCRFLSFKKSDTVYVYYKLSGRRADMWAGSVGSSFGYFPKDLIAINHLYTEHEHEIPAEETDFVCFDTGFSGFESYDVDSLLASSPDVKVNENEATSEEIEETLQSPDEASDSKSQVELLNNLEDDFTENQSASRLESHPDAQHSSPSVHEIEHKSIDVNKRLVQATKEALMNSIESATNSVTSDGNENKDTPKELIKETSANMNVASGIESGNYLDFFVNETDILENKTEVIKVASTSSSEHAQINDLKTTLGTTFDAVATDDEVTKSVTPYEEEESETDPSEGEDDNVVGTPLLTFSEDAASDKLVGEKSLPDTSDNIQDGEKEKNMWTSLGDAVFSVVTGGERTASDISSDEDDEEDDDEEEEERKASNRQKRSYGAEEKADDPAPTEPEEEPEHTESFFEQPLFKSVPWDDTDPHIKSETLSVDGADGRDKEVIVDVEAPAETVKPTETSASSVPPPSNLGSPAAPLTEQTDLRDAEEAVQHKEEPVDSGSSIDRVASQDVVVTLDNRDLDRVLAENQIVDNPELSRSKARMEESTGKMHSENLEVKDLEMIRGKTPNQVLDSVADFESNTSKAELTGEEPLPYVALAQDKLEVKRDAHIEQEEKEELMEDENALYLTQSNDTNSEDTGPETASASVSPPEPLYSDSVLRLTLLRDHLSEERMEQVQKLLGLKNLFKVEAMFSDLEVELQATRRSHTGAAQDVERALEGILEASENTILDEIEKMLDSQAAKYDDGQSPDESSSDVETEILDDFQELAFSLRQKYSTASDSAPLTSEEETDIKPDAQDLNVDKDDTLRVAQVSQLDPGSKVVTDDVGVDHEEGSAQTEEAQIVLEEEEGGGRMPHVTVEDDRGDFNKSQNDQPSLGGLEETPGSPQDTPESPVDMALSGSITPEVHEEVGLISTGMVYMSCLLSLSKSKIEEWTLVIISQLPEEWKPGETFYGCPWQVVVITALVGVITFTMFFWRTMFPVKRKAYLVDEKKLAERIQALKKEKDDALTRVSALQKQTEQLKENQKLSKEEVSITLKRIQDLESKVSAAHVLNDNMAEEKSTYMKLLEEEREASLQNKARIEKLEKSNDNLKQSRKKIQEAHAKSAILLDEAKIREDARSVQYKSLEKGHAVLKEENKTLKATIKGWEDKHRELNEQIKVYLKSLKELEDSVVLKDHNVEVLSELLADLDACDSQKDAKPVANGEVPLDKKTLIKNKIKQMMDVSRVQTTLSVVEEERDRFMAKLLSEEKSRKSLEEQHQELEHAIATMKGEKSHVENQLKILQQKNEIMVEMYQQKENALQQRLTKEELERRSKESMLSEVGGKALEAEEQVKVLRQRINEMEEQMKKTEEVYKEQIKEQENKTHSNWVNARNAERALNQEKLESSKLRQSLAVLTTQLNERRAPLFRPNTGPSAGARQGDSYGPSPVSGGAPSPPLMIEGPRRPPSAPVGRRIDPYGPRPPSDSHGRYADNKHMSGMDMMGPRSSSPANMDVSGPGSFLASPIRHSPVPGVHGPPPGPGPHDQLLPHGPPPPGRLPPPGHYRPLRPGPYQLPPGPPPPPLLGPPLPANGHPGMPMPGPPNGLPFPPRLGPGPVDPRGPLPPHFRPPPPHHFGPMPLPPGVRGPMGPRPSGPTGPPGPPQTHYPGHGDALQQLAGNHGLPQRDPSQDSEKPAMAEP